MTLRQGGVVLLAYYSLVTILSAHKHNGSARRLNEDIDATNIHVAATKRRT